MENELYFCSNCNELTEETVCPKCGKKTRKPNSDDLCYVTEFTELTRSMFVDALKGSGISCLAVPVFEGNNYMNKPSSYKVYVRYDDYNKAVEIFDDIWGGQCEETDFTNDPASAIDRLVKVTVDRPYGSTHPRHPDIKYELNSGFVEGVIGGDGEAQDAYVLDFKMPMVEYTGCVVAVIVRKNDVETKWVVGSPGKTYTKEQIAKAVHFQEKYFDIEILMQNNACLQQLTKSYFYNRQ